MKRRLLALFVATLIAVPASGAAPSAFTSPTAAPGTAQIAADGSGANPTGPIRAVPSQSYFQSMRAMYDGDYRGALEGFKLNASLGLKTAGGQWVDSICYFTMAGECHCRMGELAAALDNYNSALRLYLAYGNWMTGIQFPTVIQPQSTPPNIPWGQSAHETKVGRFPPTIPFVADRVLMDPVQLQAGAFNNYIAPGTPLPINVCEIVRCTELALKRRHELMGPVCAHDPLTESVAALLARRRAGTHPCAHAWIEAEAGMAYLGTGQTAQAVEFLKRSVTLPGDMDHPLTPIVLLELGQLALEARDYKSASDYFAEASYSAFAFGDVGVIEEAFSYGQQARLAAHPNGPDIPPPLAAAIPWSKTHGRELHATLLLLAAENNALLNRIGPAGAALAEARAEIVHHQMSAADTGARLNYLSAMVDYEQGKTADGDRALADALAFEKNGSKWLFQISLADRYAAGQPGSALARKRVLPLYETVLRDPTGADWASDPLESLSVLAVPHPLAYEHWFEIARQSSAELGLDVADRARRHRFLSTLPLGGRLLALRWVLEAPADAISPDAQLQRQELMTRYPRYADLSKQARQLRAELVTAPLAEEGADAQRKQSDKLTEFGKLSAEQEVLLHEMAVRRESTEMAFPPVRKTKEVQASLLPRQFAFIFFATHDNTYAWLMSANRCAAWKIESPPPVLERKIAATLRAIGNLDANHELPLNQLADESWRGAARDALEAVTAGSKVNLTAAIDELIIVPDGALWYLPFEALQVGKAKPAKETVSFLAKSRIRYLPTMGLAAPPRRDRRPLGEMGVVLGKLHPRDDPEAVKTQLDRLNELAPHVSAIGRPLPAPSPLYGSLFDTLVVLDDLSVSEKTIGLSDRLPYYDWSPIQLDHVRGAGSLAGWFALPWKSPAQVLLPGFHTPAENSLRQMGSGPPGSDLFLSVCGLMSTGARTVLISRWRTGGQTSGELVRQFTQELPYTGAADAWQRSVQMLWETPVDVDREPRVKRPANAEAATASHPLFWSGYMLIDTGWTPSKNEQFAAAPQNP